MGVYASAQIVAGDLILVLMKKAGVYWLKIRQ
jgi:hypothetical protein